MAVATQVFAVTTELLGVATQLLAATTHLLAVPTQLLTVATQILATSRQLLAVALSFWQCPTKFLGTLFSCHTLILYGPEENIALKKVIFTLRSLEKTLKFYLKSCYEPCLYHFCLDHINKMLNFFFRMAAYFSNA